MRWVLDANNSYVLTWVRKLAGDESVLDYGCGRGELVRAAREAGVQAFGAEKFHLRDVEDGRRWIAADPMLRDAVRELDGNRIPWSDGSFDLVVSNQVFEHVDELETVVAEIARVLKAGGRLLALYPTRETVREGHIGIPMAHWFRPGRTRSFYASSLRRVGLGKTWGNGDQVPTEWAAETLDWIDTYVRYRPRRETLRILRQHFDSIASVEDDYAAFRLGGRLGTMVSLAPVRPFVRVAIRTLATVVVVAQKGPS